MRIRGFMRWLMEKYPKIIVDAKVEAASAGEIDASAPNPNGIEFDNFYIDMKWLILYPSIEPDDDDPDAKLPSSIDDVFNNVFEYVDRLFAIVRPRKLLFLAMDGVAPRAKVNYWRAMQFLSAREDEIVEEKKKQLLEKYKKQGKEVLLQQPEGCLEGPIVVAPGTKFMFELSKALQRFVITRVRDNPAWSDIKVIISDANVPEEGNQKIMSFIRSQRTLRGYDPNTRHCLLGTGVDPILLALATHEVHFFILWEEEWLPFCKSKNTSNSHNEDLPSDMSDESEGLFEPFNGVHQKLDSGIHSPVKETLTHLLFLHISVLREYLELDLQLSGVPDGFKYDLERVIDDFIFMCFFLDDSTILPQMPTLYAYEGAIDLLMAVYKDEFKNSGGYLVDTQLLNEPDIAYINFERVERFILSVGRYEEKIFKKRHRVKQRNIRYKLSRIANSLDEKAKIHNDDEDMVSHPAANLSNEQHEALQNTKQFTKDLNRILRSRSEAFRIRFYCNHDEVNFGYSGWKERYYREKFSACSPQEVERTRRDIVKAYAEGLCWLLQYYFVGLPSWRWFCPYHYGPCASDFRGLSKVTVEFDMGSPLAPFDELMAILHPRNACVLPGAYRSLMTDPFSEILHFYPKVFFVDFDGKSDESRGVCHLPFIDEKMLLAATRTAAGKIDSSEAERNTVTVNKLFLRASSRIGSQIQSLFLDLVSNEEGSERSPPVRIQVNLREPDAIAGFIHVSNDALSEAEDIVLCLNYEFPIEREIIHRPIAGLQFPERRVFESDIQDRLMWHAHEHNYNLSVLRVASRDQYPKTNLSEDDKLFKPAASSGCVPGGSRTRGSSSNSPSSSVKNTSLYIPPHLRSRNVIPPSSSPSSYHAQSSNVRLGPPTNDTTCVHGDTVGASKP